MESIRWDVYDPETLVTLASYYEAGDAAYAVATRYQGYSIRMKTVGN